MREPELARRCEYFSADRGLDSGPLKKKASRAYKEFLASGEKTVSFSELKKELNL